MAKKCQEGNVEVSRLTDEISDILKQVEDLGDAERSRKNNDIKGMINYYNGLTDKIEDRRVRINNFSLQILAVSLAALVVMITSDKLKTDSDMELIMFGGAIVILVTFVISSLCTSFLFIRQGSFRYPFLKMKGLGTNQWKWFYYGNEEVQKINRNAIWPAEEAGKTHIPYLKGLKYFVESYKAESPKEEIRNNIQQLYLLQVHNYYKNKFYLQLTKVWEICLKFVILVIVAAAIVFMASAWIESKSTGRSKKEHNRTKVESKLESRPSEASVCVPIYVMRGFEI